MNFALRVTPADDTDLSGVIKYLQDRSNILVIVEHSLENGGGTRKHYHLHIMGLSVNDKSLYKQLDKSRVPRGNDGRSCKTKYNKENPTDIDSGNITYISKGKLEPYLLHGMSIDEYNELRSKWVEYRSVAQTKEIAKTKKSTKNVTRYDMYNEAISLLQEPYECKCVDCKHQRLIAMEYGKDYKIVWDYSTNHQHVARAGQVILQIRKKYNRGYNDHALDGDMCMLYNEGREFEMQSSWIDRYNKVHKLNSSY